jgi:L-rhamnono-1,4-lactonase
MTQTEMHKGLLVLEKAGCKTFDLGVDFRQGGSWQLVEAVKMLQKFYAQSSGKLKVVCNHFCKPNLQLNATDVQHEDRRLWEHAIKALADLATTSMKLSGLFSELPPQTSESPLPIPELIERTKFEMDVIFDNFGPENIMFGSDWPVCNVGGPGPEKSWSHWVQFVAAVLEERGLSDQDKARIWAGTAKDVYELDVDLESFKAA